MEADITRIYTDKSTTYTYEKYQLYHKVNTLSIGVKLFILAFVHDSLTTTSTHGTFIQD